MVVLLVRLIITVLHVVLDLLFHQAHAFVLLETILLELLVKLVIHLVQLAPVMLLPVHLVRLVNI